MLIYINKTYSYKILKKRKTFYNSTSKHSSVYFEYQMNKTFNAEKKYITKFEMYPE